MILSDRSHVRECQRILKCWASVSSSPVAPLDTLELLIGKYTRGGEEDKISFQLTEERCWRTISSSSRMTDDDYLSNTLDLHSSRFFNCSLTCLIVRGHWIWTWTRLGIIERDRRGAINHFPGGEFIKIIPRRMDINRLVTRVALQMMHWICYPGRLPTNLWVSQSPRYGN